MGQYGKTRTKAGPKIYENLFYVELRRERMKVSLQLQAN